MIPLVWKFCSSDKRCAEWLQGRLKAYFTLVLYTTVKIPLAGEKSGYRDVLAEH